MSSKHVWPAAGLLTAAALASPKFAGWFGFGLRGVPLPIAVAAVLITAAVDVVHLGEWARERQTGQSAWARCSAGPPTP